MNQLQKFTPGFSTKASVVVVEILWYLMWAAVLISLTLVTAVNLTGFYVRYTHAPLEVDYYPEDCSVSGFEEEAPDSGVKIVKALGLQIRHYDKGLQRIYVLMPLALAFLFLAIVTILRSFMRSVKRGNPFTMKNASRLKFLGLLVMVSGPFYGLLEYIYGMLLKSSIDVPGAVVEINPDARILFVAAGLIILVVGQVFEYGVRLREDSELTI